jgi:hypothetical protein
MPFPVAAFTVPLFFAAIGFSSAFAAEVERPLYARPATTATSFNVDAYYEYFEGLTLQEAVDVDGWTAGFDFTVPLNRSMQLRLLLPLRTEADGVLVAGGGDVDIEGWGGTFRFASLHFEHQVMGREGGANRLSYALGIGNRTAALETSIGDKYNHQGRSAHVSLRYDRILDRGGALLMDFEVRSYEESDDLNPGNLNDDRFWLFKLAGGWIGASRGRLTPALELTADVVEEFVAVSVVPELFLGATENFSVKFGVPVGITSDAPDWAAQFRLGLAF